MAVYLHQSSKQTGGPEAADINAFGVTYAGRVGVSASGAEPGPMNNKLTHGLPTKAKCTRKPCELARACSAERLQTMFFSATFWAREKRS